MATKTDACENCQTNSSFRTTNSEKDLQNIFRKLRVNNKPKKAINVGPRIKCTKVRSKSLGRLPEEMPRKRKILSDATFVFTRTDTCSLTDNQNLGYTSLRETKNPKEPFSLAPARMSSTLSAGEVSSVQPLLQGCGEQFRKGANIDVTDPLNMDDTTPEELASYFDQLLHIPKPMSQMAEMMYT